MESNSFWDMLTSRSKIAGSPRDGDRNVSSLADSSSQDQRKEFESSVFINTCGGYSKETNKLTNYSNSAAVGG